MEKLFYLLLVSKFSFFIDAAAALDTNARNFTTLPLS